MLMFVCFVKCKEQWYIKLTLLDVFNGADKPVSVSMLTSFAHAYCQQVVSFDSSHPIASEASGVTPFRSRMI